MRRKTRLCWNVLSMPTLSNFPLNFQRGIRFWLLVSIQKNHPRAQGKSPQKILSECYGWISTLTQQAMLLRICTYNNCRYHKMFHKIYF